MGDGDIKGEITKVDIGKEEVRVTAQIFGKETLYLFRLNNVDGAKWFLDSVDKNINLRLKIKDPDPVVKAITTIAKAHEGQTLKPESGWEYNPRYHDLYKFNHEGMVKSDINLVEKAGRWYADEKSVFKAASVIKVDLLKYTTSYQKTLERGIDGHKKRLENL